MNAKPPVQLGLFLAFRSFQSKLRSRHTGACRSERSTARAVYRETPRRGCASAHCHCRSLAGLLSVCALTICKALPLFLLGWTSGIAVSMLRSGLRALLAVLAVHHCVATVGNWTLVFFDDFDNGLNDTVWSVADNL